MRLVIGEIVAAHGVRGEVRVRPLTDFPDRFAALRPVWLSPPGGPARQVALESARPLPRGLWLLRLQGVERREQAEALRGAALEVEDAEAVPLPDGSYYVHQIIGLPVFTADGRPVGEVKHVLRTGANDVYVVSNGRRQHLIPAVAEFVTIALAEGRVVLRPIPGMLDEE